MRFYLDESGSTGDVARVGGALHFGAQPIFVLAAIGTIDHDALGVELRRLAAHHGVPGAELRSKNLVDKPELAGGLADYLHATDSPLFVEMMDKRFLIILNLVNYLVLPPVMGFEGANAIAMRKVICELMAVSLPDAVLVAYAKACETAHRADLDAVLPVLRRWAHDPSHCGFRDILSRIVEDSIGDIEALEEPNGHLRYLPLPDRSVTGRSISMLPGLSALTNIYARINKYRRGRLANTVLIHDEHMLFGDILSDAKRLMEQLSEEDVLPEVENADYKLREHAKLAFVSSKVAGIQAADILAGFVMRFFRDAGQTGLLTPAHRMAMAKIMRLTDQPGARGVNMVAPDTLLLRAEFLARN